MQAHLRLWRGHLRYCVSDRCHFKVKWITATPLPVVGREFGLILCFRSFSFQDQLSNVQDMQLEWALRTFRLKNTGGNAERISYHPSPT